MDNSKVELIICSYILSKQNSEEINGETLQTMKLAFEAIKSQLPNLDFSEAIEKINSKGILTPSYENVINEELWRQDDTHAVLVLLSNLVILLDKKTETT